jgi:hypothetical protein
MDRVPSGEEVMKAIQNTVSRGHSNPGHGGPSS